jgi:hypothetical protein
MNRLSNDDRAKILHLLCEGMSIRAITRLTGASKNTVAKLLIDAGKACAAYHDANVRDVKAARVQVDEIWSFTYAKQKNVASAKDAPEGAGDTWTWTALDADSKMILSYLVGGRDALDRLANEARALGCGRVIRKMGRPNFYGYKNCLPIPLSMAIESASGG